MFLLLFFLFFFIFPLPSCGVLLKAPLLVSVFWSKMNHFSSEVMGAAEDPSASGSPLLLPLSADSFWNEGTKSTLLPGATPAWPVQPLGLELVQELWESPGSPPGAAGWGKQGIVAASNLSGLLWENLLIFWGDLWGITQFLKKYTGQRGSSVVSYLFSKLPAVWYKSKIQNMI